MTTDEIATLTRPHRLSVKLALDGTRRHYLLHHPNPTGKVPDLMDYSRHCTEQYVRICDMLFSLGIHSIMALNLWPPDIERRENDFLRLTLRMSELALLHPNLISMATKWSAAIRLYGDYDVASKAEVIRDGLAELDTKLTALTPEQDHLLLFGFYAGAFEDELITRTLALRDQLGRPPTALELKVACFPDGPDKLDIFINGGWLRTDNSSLPPLLNQGDTELYSLNQLVLDLDEITMRKILFDCLFVRRAASPADDLAYGPTALQQLSTYYAKHRHCFVGMGELVGPDLWYPDHHHLSEKD